MVGSTSPYSKFLVAGGGENASIITLPQHDVPGEFRGEFFIARPSTRSIVAICGAAGGAVALVVIFALIYVLRVRRNVRRFQRSMDVLGPELTPLSRPSENTSVDFTLPIYSRFKTDDDLTPHPFSYFPPRTNSEPANFNIQPCEETFGSLSPTRTPTWAAYISDPSSAVSIRTPGPYERPRSLSTPAVSSPAAQSRSSLTHTRRMTIGAPSTPPPPLRLHEYRPSCRSTADTPSSPTRRRRRRRRPADSVDGLPTPPETPDQHGRFRPPNTPPVTTPSNQDDNEPLSPTRRSTIIIGPPPPAARRLGMYPNLTREINLKPVWYRRDTKTVNLVFLRRLERHDNNATDGQYRSGAVVLESRVGPTL
ncbi:hypothetical protein BGW80DRAFT_1251950 [Lactifluus volemus]|nr:hypothetical protein BGW80DRAFT_1251950 [Lactifluus volemus]